jgi:hypothetical protein
VALDESLDPGVCVERLVAAVRVDELVPEVPTLFLKQEPLADDDGALGVVVAAFGGDGCADQVEVVAGLERDPGIRDGALRVGPPVRTDS